nr:uncharacterized protein c3f10.08c [Quercus suber]
MAVAVLGKRKRRAPSRDLSREEVESSDEDMRARFQRAFEAKFKPLPQRTIPADSIPVETNQSVEEDDDISDWEGITSADEDTVEVVHHHSEHEVSREEQKRELKAFMSSKPPSSIDALFATTAKRKPPNLARDDDDTESANLKHDLALQRLLKESHLLDSDSVKSGVSYAPQGKARLKAMDLRMKDIGAKKAIMVQEKMPMAFRKGITAKGAAREAARRKEAAENGIVLEKVRATGVKGGKIGEKRRERGIGGLGVGRFQGGTLKLSQRDPTAAWNGLLRDRYQEVIVEAGEETLDRNMWAVQLVVRAGHNERRCDVLWYRLVESKIDASARLTLGERKIIYTMSLTSPAFCSQFTCQSPPSSPAIILPGSLACLVS